MTVEPVIGEEGVFLVQSRGRPEIKHRVDLQFVEEGKRKPAPYCSCEQFTMHPQLKGIPCAHIHAAVRWELRRLEQLPALDNHDPSIPA